MILNTLIYNNIYIYIFIFLFSSLDPKYSDIYTYIYFLFSSLDSISVWLLREIGRSMRGHFNCQSFWREIATKRNNVLLLARNETICQIYITQSVLLLAMKRLRTQSALLFVLLTFIFLVGICSVDIYPSVICPVNIKPLRFRN